MRQRSERPPPSSWGIIWSALLRAAAFTPTPASRAPLPFRDTGSFDAAGSLSQENAEAFCRDFCKAFSYDTPIFTLDETGSGTATAVRLWNGTPVFNAAVTFTIDQGRVLSASGALLPETGAETSSGQKPLSAFAALTAFQQMQPRLQLRGVPPSRKSASATNCKAPPPPPWRWSPPGGSSRIRQLFM